MAARRNKAVDWLVYFVVRVVLCVLQTLTLEACGHLARGIAWLLNDVLRVRRRTTEENLQLIFPELTAEQRLTISRRMWESLFLTVCEVAQAPRRLHDTNWRTYIDLSREHKRQIVQMLLDSRPVVVVSGHYGNFELGCFIIGLLGFPSHALVRPLDNPYLNDYLQRFREMKGQYLLPKDGSANQIAALLETGGKLVLAGDQHAGPKGCWVDFLGRPASCHKGVALFTLTSGAPMVVVTVTRQADPEKLQARPMKFQVRVEGVADPRELPSELASVTGLTRWYNLRLEQGIRRQPHQYWWLHRRWRDAPPPRRAKNSDAPPQTDAQRPAA